MNYIFLFTQYENGVNDYHKKWHLNCNPFGVLPCTYLAHTLEANLYPVINVKIVSTAIVVVIHIAFKTVEGLHQNHRKFSCW